MKASTRLLSARPKTKVFWMKCHSSHCKDINPCREKSYKKCAENKLTKNGIGMNAISWNLLSEKKCFVNLHPSIFNLTCWQTSLSVTVRALPDFSPACSNYLKHVLRFSKQMFNKSVSNAKAVESRFLITNNNLIWKS